jgi:pantetheine-phosphate adenylyltransferase
MGGTFDPFHIGHEALIQKAIDISQKVLIGLTTDKRAKASRPNFHIAPYNHRKSRLESWLQSKGALHKVEIVPLEDNWGPAALEEKFEGIIVSQETEKMANELNQVRKKRRVMPLEVIVVSMVDAYDGNRISSSRIRSGEIDSRGLKT